METKDWLIFVGPLVGVVITAAIGIRLKKLEFRQAVIEENRKRYLDKREELYEELGEVATNLAIFSGFILSISKASSSAETLSQVNEIIHKLIKAMPRMDLLANIYAPEIHHLCGSAILSITDVSKAGTAYLLKRGDDNGHLQQSLGIAIETCQNARHQLGILIKEESLNMQVLPNLPVRFYRWLTQSSSN